MLPQVAIGLEGPGPLPGEVLAGQKLVEFAQVSHRVCGLKDPHLSIGSDDACCSLSSGRASPSSRQGCP